MIWFWSRERQRMRLETRYDNDTSEFVMVIEHPDGRRETERFEDIGTFRERLIALEQAFEAEHWTQSGKPEFVPEWFPQRRLDSQPLTNASEGRTTIMKRAYTAGLRVFELTLSMVELKGQSLWTVEHVTELSANGAAAPVPGMFAVVSPTEEATFARACDRIDKWLLSQA
jgi:hypothetical protein